MDKHKSQFQSQKANAKRRGIDWQFTFEEWLAFWGDDIDKRGTGHDRLCMQRFGDVGPYHPANVKKGYAKDNAKTAGVIKRHKRIADCAKTKQTQNDWAEVHRAYLEAA